MIKLNYRYYYYYYLPENCNLQTLCPQNLTTLGRQNNDLQPTLGVSVFKVYQSSHKSTINDNFTVPANTLCLRSHLKFRYHRVTVMVT
jgi:hypothetical protein